MNIYLINTEGNIKNLPPFTDTEEYFLTHGLKKTIEEFVDYFNSGVLDKAVKIRAIEDLPVISDEDMNDIIVTALEGGINYWCQSALPKNNDYKGKSYASDVVSAGGSLMIDPGEGDDIEELTKDKFLKGLLLWKKENNILEIDPGQIDAGDSDSIIQLALYGKVVYG